MSDLTETPSNPRLRLLDGHFVLYEGMKYYHLEDPLRISGKTLLIPEPVIPLLNLLDGTRDNDQLRAIMSGRYGIRMATNQIDQLIQSFDEALFLENAQYQQAREELETTFRAGSCRPAAFAGHTYPENPDQIRELLWGALGNVQTDASSASPIRGLLSPHIDYDRGMSVYAAAWARAAGFASKVEQVILLGSDHFSEGLPVSLTRLDYCTPLGRMPIRADWVDQLANILSDEAAFQGELHHRSEHSIELALVWLQTVLGGREVDFLPVLCGPLITTEFSHLSNNPSLNNTINWLHELATRKPTWVIAAGDFSHVGPAFGGEPIKPEDLEKVRSYDQVALQTLLKGDAAGFFSCVNGNGDRTNVCGLSPIYWMLRILGRSHGRLHAYDVVPADVAKTSFVSLAGMSFF